MLRARVYGRTLLLCALLCADRTAVSAATIDFTTLAPFTTVDYFSTVDATIAESITAQDVTVTGSANVINLQFNGLSIEGGASSLSVDTNEFLLFTFTAPVIDVTYFVSSWGNTNADGIGGQRLLQAFSGATSLGTVTQSDGATAPVSSLFGDAPITAFSLQSPGFDTFRVGTLTYTLAPVSAPEPASLLLLGTGLLGAGVRRWRQKRP